MVMPQKISDDATAPPPLVIPRVELTGSPADRLLVLDAFIVRLQQLRRTLVGDALPPESPSELHGPYLHAPVWPWFVAGWIVGALFVLMFVVARIWA